MSHPIRVARVDELPPGKGKQVELAGGVSITVVNVEGRYRARVADPLLARAAAQPPPGIASTEAIGGVAHGPIFDADADADTTLAERAGEPEASVTVEGEYVVLRIASS